MSAEILDQFVAKNDIREFLRTPFNGKAFTYATNGAMAVRMPRIEGFPDNDKIPDSLDRYFERTAKQEFVKLESIPDVAHQECEFCGGSGRMTICSECNGDGDVECDLGHYHECRACNGKGRVHGNGSECDECEGKGKVAELTRMIIGKTHVDARYAEVINALPAVEFALQDDPDGPVYFRFNGGEGLLMPLRR